LFSAAKVRQKNEIVKGKSFFHSFILHLLDKVFGVSENFCTFAPVKHHEYGDK